MTHKFPNINLLIDLHNQARSKSWFYKLKPLQEDKRLSQYASDWSIYMANKIKKLKHSHMQDIMKLGFNYVAENIAYGQNTEQQVMDAWLNSYGHKKNIMNKKFTHIGVGFSYNNKDQIYWCVCFGRK